MIFWGVSLCRLHLLPANLHYFQPALIPGQRAGLSAPIFLLAVVAGTIISHNKPIIRLRRTATIPHVNIRPIPTFPVGRPSFHRPSLFDHSIFFILCRRSARRGFVRLATSHRVTDRLRAKL